MFECVDACVCVRTYVCICVHVKVCMHSLAMRRTVAAVDTLSESDALEPTKAQRLIWLRLPGAALDPRWVLLAKRSTHQVLTQLRPATSDTKSLALQADGFEVIMWAFVTASGCHTPSIGECCWLARWARWSLLHFVPCMLSLLNCARLANGLPLDSLCIPRRPATVNSTENFRVRKNCT